MTLPRDYSVDGLTSCPMKYRACTSSWQGPIRARYQDAVIDAWLHFGLPFDYRIVEVDRLNGESPSWRAYGREALWAGPLRSHREVAVEDAWRHAGPEAYRRYLEHTKSPDVGRRADTSSA